MSYPDLFHALGHQKFTGQIERISPATSSEFGELKPDNATTSFSKVVQRITIRIDIDPGQKDLNRLCPGMSVITQVRY